MQQGELRAIVVDTLCIGCGASVQGGSPQDSGEEAGGAGVAKRGVLYELPAEGRNAIRFAAVEAALSLLLSTLEEN